MKIHKLSPKQKEILRFILTDKTALICDGAVRSGKTTIMAAAFLIWAMDSYDRTNFGICGKTVQSAERNVLKPLQQMEDLPYSMAYKVSTRCLTVRCGGKENYFYLFGGKDESSYMLIQGITLAGVMLDEVALMPRSFVEQALARCSVSGSKLWFNCNPENPRHWFREEWIKKADEKKALHLHFLMDDNPSLDEATRQRYRNLYTGIFYERYILGRWVMSEGLIYDMFDPTSNTYTDAQRPESLHFSGMRTIACDYGTVNPTVFLDIYDYDGHFYVDREYRWDSRKEGRQKTDEEYAGDMVEFVGQNQCMIIVDPSAASFIEALRRRGLYVVPANNDVIDGIRKTGVLLQHRAILIHQTCEGLIDEMALYLWDQKSSEDKPVKENDHGPDALRYYVNSLADWRLG